MLLWLLLLLRVTLREGDDEGERRFDSRRDFEEGELLYSLFSLFSLLFSLLLADFGVVGLVVVVVMFDFGVVDLVLVVAVVVVFVFDLEWLIWWWLLHLIWHCCYCYCRYCQC